MERKDDMDFLSILSGIVAYSVAEVLTLEELLILKYSAFRFFKMSSLS